MAPVVWVIWVSDLFSGVEGLFVFVRRSGIRGCSFKLRILGREGFGVLVGGRGAQVEGKVCVYFVEGKGLSDGVEDEGACFRGLLASGEGVSVAIFVSYKV